MYKKILTFLFVLFSVVVPLLSTPASVSAQTDLVLGENQYYSVVLRGNGEAIVYARLVLNNPDDSPMTNFSFTLPNVSPYEMSIFQQKLPQVCVQYTYPASGQTCVKYQDPDYNIQFGYSGADQPEYQKIHYTHNEDKYSFTLPTPIDAYKSGAVIVSYATKAYTKESWGLFTFHFETIKVPTRVLLAKVSIDVDSDLYLKGNQSQVNYQSSTPAVSKGVASDIASPTLNQIVNQIGVGGVLIKQAQDLAPNESYTVNGEYATSWWRLNLGSMLIGIGVVIALILIVFGLTKFINKKNKHTRESNNAQEISHGKKTTEDIKVLGDLMMGLLSAFIVVILTVGFIQLSQIESMYLYDQLLSLIIVVLVFLVYGFAVLGPGVFMAIRYNWKNMLLVLGMEFVWLMVFVIIYIVFFQTGLNRTTPNPVPLPAIQEGFK